MATHSDNTNKTDGLPALTEAKDDDNEIPELIPVIEHGKHIMWFYPSQ
jgi:hypothetical protein